MKKENRIVVDTGVLVSAFAFGGIPALAVQKASRDYIVCVSKELLDEYREVPLALEQQGKIDHQQLKALIAGISSFVSGSLVISPGKKFDLCRDPEDNMLIECCFEGKASVLMTGDKDLHSIKNLPFILNIVTPAEFMKRNLWR